MAKQFADLLPGTLDMLILKAVSLKPLHGYGVLLRIAQISKDVLDVPQGSLYPALYRLEHQGLINAEWGESENKRRAKFYTLTPEQDDLEPSGRMKPYQLIQGNRRPGADGWRAAANLRRPQAPELRIAAGPR